MPSATLADLIANDHVLSTWCPSGGKHGRDLEPAEFVGRYGADMEVLAIARRLRCERCGGRGGEVTVATRQVPLSRLFTP
jgi:hypothetical protein